MHGLTDQNSLDSDAGDELLARRFFSGDNQAGLVLFKRHEKGIWDFIYRFTGRNYQDAWDAYQETLYRFIKYLKTEPFTVEGTGVRGLLYRTARNIMIDMERKQKHTTRCIIKQEHTSLSVSPPEKALDAEGEEKLMTAMLKLPADERNVIVLYYYNYKTFKEIGSDLGISEATAQRTLKGAEESLRRLLKQGVKLDGTDYS
jgi:RNA polymerase sigma-70 factor (ECF subfamily)